MEQLPTELKNIKPEKKSEVDPDSYNKLENYTAVFDILLGFSMSIVYLVALVLLLKRKDFQPLKSRSVSLIFVSTLGNFLFFSAIMYNKILSNNRWPIWDELENPDNISGATNAAVEVSCFFSNSQ